MRLMIMGLSIVMILTACESEPEPEPTDLQPPSGDAQQSTAPEKPQPEKPQRPQPGFISLVKLGCTESGCGELVLQDSDKRLARAMPRLARRYPDGEPFVGVLPGSPEDAELMLEPAMAAEMLAGQDISPDPEGAYNIHSFAVDSPGCAVTEISEEEGETEAGEEADDDESEVSDGMPGGICATLAVAHCLVHRLEVVPEDWDSVSDGDNWAADFLKAIYAASGDDDGNRDINEDEVDEAHQADWNDKWDVSQSNDWEQKPEDGDCDELQQWCEDLERYRETDGDNCLLKTRRPESGHQLTIDTVEWNEDSCRCVVTTAHTGQQDGDAADFSDVPKEPGTQTWELGPNEEIEVTSGPSKNFYNNRYRDAYFACYEKQRVEEVDEDTPGDAMPE